MEKKVVSKEADKFKRENTTERDAFIERCKKELKCEVKIVDVSNKQMPQEPILTYKGRKIAWCAPRSGHLWTNYVFFIDRDKEIHKISTQADIDKEYDIIKELVKQIDALPSQKERPTHKRSKRKSNKISPTKPRSIFQIEEQIQRLGKKSNALHIKVVTPEIKRWAESKGYKFVDDGHTLMVRELEA